MNRKTGRSCAFLSIAGALLFLFLFVVFLLGFRFDKGLVSTKDHIRTDKMVTAMVKDLKSGKTATVRFYSTMGTDLLLQRFRGMPEIRKIVLQQTDASNDSMLAISEMQNVEEVVLYGCEIDDSGVSLIQSLNSLTTLRLINTEVSDEGIRLISSLSHLKDLTVFKNPYQGKGLTDESSQWLGKMSSLRRLALGGRWMSDSEISKLRLALPHCDIIDSVDPDDFSW